MNATFAAWIETLRMAARGFHWHNGQCCTERILAHPPTMAARVDWYNYETGEYQGGAKR